MISTMLDLPALFLVCRSDASSVVSARTMFSPAPNESSLNDASELKIRWINLMLSGLSRFRSPLLLLRIRSPKRSRTTRKLRGVSLFYLFPGNEACSIRLMETGAVPKARESTRQRQAMISPQANALSAISFVATALFTSLVDVARFKQVGENCQNGYLL